MNPNCCFCTKDVATCKTECYEFDYKDFEPDMEKINKHNGLVKCPNCEHTFRP